MGKSDSRKYPAADGPPSGKDARPPKTTVKENALAEEFGGPKGLEPTRYGDWERKGIVSDF